MTLHMVTCPLCCQPGFSTSEELSSALVLASTRKLFCPVCNEVLTGLDKLTIHLFGHNMGPNKNSGASDISASNTKIATSRNPSHNHPVVYFQSDSGQLFAIAASSVLNQYGAVTINTQNFISNAQPSHAATKPTISAPDEPKEKENSEFASCKDLLTSGDFSVGGDDTEIIAEADGQSSVCQSSVDNNAESTVGDDASKNMLPCDACDMSFSNKAILAVHKQLLHKNHTFPRSEEGERQKEMSTCTYCPSTFNLKSSLLVHMKVTHPVQKDALELQQKETEKPGCPVCGKTFPKEGTLHQHMRSAHGEKPWPCTVCSKTFTTKYFLRKHKRIHTGETPYECGICHKVFTFQQSYHKHMLYHTDNKPYCCSHCGRLFKELSTLNNHERIHSGEKPFSCETCGKSFRQRVSYLVHRRIHTGAMPYKCTACNKSFRYKISQRTHKCPEHPPGVVVKTRSTLIDRLQAVINKEEEKQERLSASQSISVDAACSNATHQHAICELPSIPKSIDCNENKQNSRLAYDSSNMQSCLGSDDVINSLLPNSDLIPTCGPHNTEQDAIPSEDFNLPEMLFGVDEPVVHSPSANVDSSPSECLGRLHISSSEHKIPDHDLSFDNMDDLDFSNLLFDIS